MHLAERTLTHKIELLRMDKMRATFYVLAVLGALLEPLLAETETSNTTGASTTTPRLQNLNPVDKNSSVDVSNATEAYDVNTTRAENSTISSTHMPPVEETNTMTKSSNVHTTTKKMKDVHTTAKDTRPLTIESTTTTTKIIPAPTDVHVESKRSPVYVVILIIVILVVAVIGFIFFCVKSNRKRFSVNIHAKQEDAQIPLASVEPEMCDSSPKGTDLKTFTSDETSPTDGLEKTKEQKAPTKADQQVTESPAKSHTTEPPAEKSLEPIFVDDADPTASTKTSVETLNDVLNDNNSNNNAVRDVSVPFIEICLND